MYRIPVRKGLNMIFRTKLKEDELYKRNGQEVKVLEENKPFVVIEFKDGTIAEVFENEIYEENNNSDI